MLTHTLFSVILERHNNLVWCVDYITKRERKQGQEFFSCPCPSNHIFNRNDKSEHTTHLDNVVRIIITWSE